jgi:hypothetical protein
MQLNLVEPIRYGTHCVGGSTHKIEGLCEAHDKPQATGSQGSRNIKTP